MRAGGGTLEDVHAVQPDLYRFLAPLGRRGSTRRPQRPGDGGGLPIGKEQQGTDILPGAPWCGRTSQDQRSRTCHPKRYTRRFQLLFHASGEMLDGGTRPGDGGDPDRGGSRNSARRASSRWA